MSGQSERLTLSLLWSFMTPLPSECHAHPHHAARSAFRRAPLLYKVLFHIYLQKRESSWTPLMCLTGPPRILYSRVVLGNAKKSAVRCKISATTDLAFGQVQVFWRMGEFKIHADVICVRETRFYEFSCAIREDVDEHRGLWVLEGSKLRPLL